MKMNNIKTRKKTFLLLIGIITISTSLCACSFIDKVFNKDGGTAESQAEVQADARVPANSAEETSDTGNGDDSTASMNENAKAEMIEVTVSEDKYIFEDKVMDIDELKGIIEGKEGAVVKITDENSTLNAYKDLTAYLEERGIEFTEENN